MSDVTALWLLIGLLSLFVLVLALRIYHLKEIIAIYKKRTGDDEEFVGEHVSARTSAEEPELWRRKVL